MEKSLPKEIRDLLARYATSGPYILSRLPKKVQEKLLWYLGPNELIKINNISPEVVWDHEADFWTRKSEHDLQRRGLFAEDLRDYLLYVIANEARLFDLEDVQRWMSDPEYMQGRNITAVAAEEAVKTGNYSVVDKMMKISPGKVLWSAHDELYDYIYARYPKYRVPLMFMEAMYGKPERVDLSTVTEKDGAYWSAMVAADPEPFEDAVDRL